MSNKEKFNAALNSCQNPQAVYGALLALGKAGILHQLQEEATV